ncbi:MAG: hypothetical protein WC365_01545 [Candidatus Babeliales bacterium]|jgi:hypothetical protein
MKVGDLVEDESLYEEPVAIPKTNVMVINPDDPYDTPDERAECNDFIFQKFFCWSGVDGTFSTWRERHVFLRGFRNGFGTTLFSKFECTPAMWNDEAQYYEAGQEMGYVIKIGFQISAVFIATQLGVLTALTGGVDVTTAVEPSKELVSKIVDAILTRIGL